MFKRDRHCEEGEARRGNPLWIASRKANLQGLFANLKKAEQ